MPIQRVKEPDMEHAEWIWAAVAFGSGLLFGEIAGRLARRAMDRRGVAAREHAGAVGSFIFWASTAVGLIMKHANEIQTLRVEKCFRLVGETCVDKGILQKAPDQKFHREIIDPLRPGSISRPRGLDPGPDDAVTHGQRQRDTPVVYGGVIGVLAE